MSNFAVHILRKNIPDEDLFTDIVFSNGALGVEEKDTILICSFIESKTEKEILNLFQSEGLAILKLVEIQEKNWMESWKKSYTSIELKKFIIHPSWEKINRDDKLLIEIDPKMAFGTGTHETTQLILDVLPLYFKKNMTVLDAGTGSGILAIASEKLGAESVFAFDIDPQAIENCRENCEINHCKKVHAEVGDIKINNEKFDLVLANINRNILIKTAADLMKRMKYGAILILSGLLIEDEALVKNEYKDLKFLDSVSKGEWLSLIYKK